MLMQIYLYLVLSVCLQKSIPLPCLCLQPLPPSSVEQSQVWLAVNEDGLCVLDYTMVSVCLGSCLYVCFLSAFTIVQVMIQRFHSMLA